jgi:hypothetical protein
VALSADHRLTPFGRLADNAPVNPKLLLGTLVLVAASLAGCATPERVVAVAPPAAKASAPSIPAPGTPPPFATVIKDAQRIEGPLVLWQKEEKVWLELTPQQFGQPFLLSPKFKTGIGEAWVMAGLMVFPISGAGGSQVVQFVRVQNQVRLQAMNLEVTAPPGTPEARAVESSFSHSLLGSTAVASAPHPDSKAVLIEANGMFLSDMLGVGMTLQRAFRQGYSLDSRHTTINAVRGSAQATVIETQNHYYSGSVASTQPGLIGPAPTLPRYLPDTRSLLVTLNYSISPLPALLMSPRKADPRVGLFTTTLLDFGNDLARTPRQRYVNRWRLEKKDPAADTSEPAKPITFWIDRNVPVAYRDTVRSAILEWNKAFEQIGFKEAIVVRQQSDDASFDTLDTGYPSVRWMMGNGVGISGIGQSHVDPRSGEILDAKVNFEGLETRIRRNERAQVLASTATFGAVASEPEAMCSFGDAAADQVGYALDVLAARDELDPAGPEAQQYVLDYVKEVIMHEVGHALGLRHNFRASRVYTEAQLSDPEFTREHGTSGSVMEYTPVNLGRPGERSGVPFQLTLGPYDYWAIEYAYRALAADQEVVELQRIAGRNTEPLLAYGTDEDSAFGLDPETMQFDLGADPVAFAAKRLDIARDLFRRQETRQLPANSDYAALRRSLAFALGDINRAIGVLARQIGGVRTLRDFPGSGRDPLQPVDARVQRQSLDLIVKAVLGAEGLTLSPALQRRLAPDYLDRGELGVPTDFSLPQRLLELQRSVLGYLMSEALAARVLDSAAKVDRQQEAFRLSDLYNPLDSALWSDLGRPGAIASPRRELQRDHVNRLANTLLRPQARADARSLLRQQAQALLAKLDGVNRRGTHRDAETRAHLIDSADSLRQALAARLPRSSV